jgi:hypothetical protein
LAVPLPWSSRPSATHYLVALAIIIGFAVVLIWRAATRGLAGRFSPHFFVLGAAFLLLETRSIITFSLLFGTTWLVNSLVFFAVLAACWRPSASRINSRSRPNLYAGLFGSIAIAPAAAGHPAHRTAWLRYARPD